MSGGHFDYNNHKIDEMVDIVRDDIQQLDVEENFKEHYTEEQLMYMNKFKNLLKAVAKLAHSYDYAISGDTNLDDFVKDYKEFEDKK